MKTLDSKLKAITSGKYQPEHFILSDAKDPDMALGVTAPGPHGTRAAFLDAMRAIVSQKLMDVMLGSASNIEELARTGVFAKSGVTPAIRANDTTDIWLPRHGSYSAEPSRPRRRGGACGSAGLRAGWGAGAAGATAAVRIRAAMVGYG